MNGRSVLYRTILGLHRDLLLRVYQLDILLVACATAYLLAPLSRVAVTLNSLVFLIVFVLGCTCWLMHAMRTCCADPAFYLCLPVRRGRTLLMLYGAAILPSIAVFLVIAACTAFIPDTIRPADSAARAGQAIVILVLIKVLALPSLVAVKRHPAALVGFYLLLALVQIAVSVADEFLLHYLPMRQAVEVALFTALSIWVSLRFVNTARIE